MGEFPKTKTNPALHEEIKINELIFDIQIKERVFLIKVNCKVSEGIKVWV